MTLRDALEAYSTARSASWIHAPATLEAYRTDLTILLTANLATELETILIQWTKSPDEIAGLFNGKRHSPRSLARKASAIRDWWRWLEETAQITQETLTKWGTLVPEFEFAMPLPKALHEDELIQFLAPLKETPAPEALSPGLATLWSRDRALLLLMLCTGMRVSEAVSLRLDQIDFEQCVLQVTGKRGKSRWLPYPDWVGKIVQDYIQTLRPLHLSSGASDSQTVFIGKRGHPLTRQAVWKRIKQHALCVGLGPDRAHPHVLRHTFATDMLHAGLPLRALQLLLGHASSATTEIYTHVSPEHLAEVHARCHPLG